MGRESASTLRTMASRATGPAAITRSSASSACLVSQWARALSSRRSSVASKAASSVNRPRSSGGHGMFRSAGEALRVRQLHRRQIVLDGVLRIGDGGEEDQIRLQLALPRQMGQTAARVSNRPVGSGRPRIGWLCNAADHAGIGLDTRKIAHLALTNPTGHVVDVSAHGGKKRTVRARAAPGSQHMHEAYHGRTAWQQRTTKHGAERCGEDARRTVSCVLRRRLLRRRAAARADEFAQPLAMVAPRPAARHLSLVIARWCRAPRWRHRHGRSRCR